jgi:putative heme-binding domain-containing protein
VLDTDREDVPIAGSSQFDCQNAFPIEESERREERVEPSREISDQYGTSLVTLRDGRQLTGRIINYTEQGLQLAENLFDPAQAVRLADRDIVSIATSKHSLMPPGLLDVLHPDEILDLLAFLSPAAP